MARFLGFFLFLVLGPYSAHAFEWPGDSFELASGAQTLPRGKTAVSVLSQRREVSHRISWTGSRVPLRKAMVRMLGNEQAPDRVTYRLRAEQIRFVPAWMYGLTSTWSIGARVPIIQYNSETQIEVPGAEVKKHENVQIGNVEFQSKVGVYSSSKSTLAVAQRLKFPSAGPLPDEVLIDPYPEPGGYSVGAGGAYEYILSSNLTVGALLFHDVYFEDKIHRESVSGEWQVQGRKPGDKTTAGLSAEIKMFSGFTMSLGLIEKYKTADRVSLPADSAESSRPLPIRQRLGEISLAFEPQLSAAWLYKSIDRFSARIKYYTTLGGSNIEEADTVSLQLQVMY